VPDSSPLPFDPTVRHIEPHPPRKPLGRYDFAVKYHEQNGCCYLCGGKLERGKIIDEHSPPRKCLPPSECDDLKYRKLACKSCATAKTKVDAGIVAKTRRLQNGRGSQWAKRQKRGGSSIKGPAVSALSKEHGGYRKPKWASRKFETRKA
jgi:hypothetical protein